MKKRAISLMLAALFLAAMALPANAEEETVDEPVDETVDEPVDETVEDTVEDTSGRLVEAAYEDARPFSGGFAAVKLDGKWGYIDETGKVAVDFEYACAGDFEDGAALVAFPHEITLDSPDLDEETVDAETHTVYDLRILRDDGMEAQLCYSSGDAVTVWDYEDLEKKHIADVKCHGGVFILDGYVFDRDGGVIEPNAAAGEKLNSFALEKLMAEAAGDPDMYRSLTENGDVAFQVSYRCANQPCTDGTILMVIDIYYGQKQYTGAGYFLMDTQGGMVGEVFDRDRAYLSSSVRDGLISAYTYSGGKYHCGMLRVDGAWAIEPDYDNYRYQLDGTYFCDGLWVVEKDGKFGAVDTAGKIVIPLEYDFLDIFHEGLAAASKDGERFYLDTHGNRYSVGLPGGGTAESLSVTGLFSSAGVAVVYDDEYGRAYLITDTPVDGVLPAVPGSEDVDSSIYLPGFDGTAGSIDSAINPGEPVLFEEEGLYGYYKLSFDLTGLNPYGDVLPGDWYFEPILWSVREDISDPADAGEYDVTSGSPRSDIVMSLWRASGRPEPTIEFNPFTDIDETDAFYTAALWAYEKGITTGTGDGLFSPDMSVSREQIVTFLWRAAGKPETEEGDAFTDVSADDYFAGAVKWAVASGITTGTGGGKFSPKNECTRGELITFLYRQFGKQE